MRNFVSCISKSSLSLLFFSTVCAAAAPGVEVKNPPANNDAATNPLPAVNGNLEAGAITTKAWLEIVDSGQYDKSWDETANQTKLTASKKEWHKILDKTRKPLGSVKSRKVADIRTAKDPHNLLPGDYLVMIYKTSFANKESAYELVTLYLQDGQWRVLTYQID